uniref:Chemosensory protein n=1 Tax=Heliothis virescens TaxID=7102 RepID=A0A2A4IWE4_HELVI
MKLFIVLALVAAVVGRPDEAFYDKKYDDFNVDEIIDNVRLLKAYAHCIIGDGKCTPEGNDFKKWVPEATKSSCGKCTEKQKVLVAKTIKAMRDKLPEEYTTLVKQIDPENKYDEDLKSYLAKYGS